MGNLEVVRGIYAAMATKDVGEVLARLHPECVIEQDARLPWGGRHVGHQGFAEFGIALVGSIDSSVRIDAIYEPDDHTVVQFGHTIGTVVANGDPFDLAEMHLWTLENGLVTRAFFAIDSTGMLEALGT